MICTQLDGFKYSYKLLIIYTRIRIGFFAFNGISTFMGYLILRLLKNSSGTHSWEVRKIILFLGAIVLN